jgi:acyl transferase domain-containing protein
MNTLFRDYFVVMARICLSHGFPSFLPMITDPDMSSSEALPVQTQTAIVAIELAIVNMWKDFGVKPDMVMGHSLGEFASLCTAGVVSVSTCLYLVGRRASLMVERYTPGTHAMLAIHDTLGKVCEHLSAAPHQVGANMVSEDTIQGCEIACVNGAKSTVVSGPTKQVEKLRQQLQMRGIRSTLLSVPYAFHSSRWTPYWTSMRKRYPGFPSSPSRYPLHQHVSALLSLGMASSVLAISAGNTRVCSVYASCRRIEADYMVLSWKTPCLD